MSKNIKHRIEKKSVAILCVIFIIIVLCSVAAKIIIDSRAKFQISVQSIIEKDGTEKTLIAGKSNNFFSAFITNDKKYINKSNEIKLDLKGTDDNYSGNTLTTANIIVEVGGATTIYSDTLSDLTEAVTFIVK